MGDRTDEFRSEIERSAHLLREATGVNVATPPPGRPVGDFVRKVDTALAALSDGDKRSVLTGLLRELIPAGFARDLQAFADFVRVNPPPLCFADRDRIARLYLRLAAVAFVGGFNQQGKTHFEMAERAYRTLIAAIHTFKTGDPAETAIRLFGKFSGELLSWSGMWFRVGCPRVRLSAAEAAALALTDIESPLSFGKDGNGVAPWSSFLIEIPPGALRYQEDDKESEVDRVMVSRFDDTMADGSDLPVWFTFIGSGAELVSGPNLGASLRAEVEAKRAGMFEEMHTRSSGAPITPAILRVIAAATRIAAGVCFALANKVADGKLRVRHSPPSRVGGMPQTTDVRLGLPVKIDFTQALNDYTLGRKSIVRKSQWVVRGHWRNQACGKDFAEHRAKWIQPYWKGPQGMPILVRVHEVGK